MKLKINEVIENVKDELLCYEEGEKLVNRWEKEFKEWIEKNKGKKKDIVVTIIALLFIARFLLVTM